MLGLRSVVNMQQGWIYNNCYATVCVNISKVMVIFVAIATVTLNLLF